MLTARDGRIPGVEIGQADAVQVRDHYANVAGLDIVEVIA